MVLFGKQGRLTAGRTASNTTGIYMLQVDFGPFKRLGNSTRSQARFHLVIGTSQQVDESAKDWPFCFVLTATNDFLQPLEDQHRSPLGQPG